MRSLHRHRLWVPQNNAAIVFLHIILMCILAKRNSLFELRYLAVFRCCCFLSASRSCVGVGVGAWCDYLCADSLSSVCRATNTSAQTSIDSDAMRFWSGCTVWTLTHMDTVFNKYEQKFWIITHNILTHSIQNTPTQTD